MLKHFTLFFCSVGLRVMEKTEFFFLFFEIGVNRS